MSSAFSFPCSVNALYTATNLLWMASIMGWDLDTQKVRHLKIATDNVMNIFNVTDSLLYGLRSSNWTSYYSLHLCVQLVLYDISYTCALNINCCDVMESDHQPQLSRSHVLDICRGMIDRWQFRVHYCKSKLRYQMDAHWLVIGSHVRF